MNEEIIIDEVVKDLENGIADEATPDIIEENTEPVCEETTDTASVDSDGELETVAQLQDTILSLREKISELERARDSQEKMLGQLSDFTELFPTVDIGTIPESVWNTVKAGTSLAAAYALYEKRVAVENMRIEKINSLNSLKSAGAAGKNTASEFFTPDDVRKMSQAEVHANFSKIKKSMEKWN